MEISPREHAVLHTLHQDASDQLQGLHCHGFREVEVAGLVQPDERLGSRPNWPYASMERENALAQQAKESNSLPQNA